MIVEIHSLEMQVEMIVGTQPQRCLCRDDVEYCHVETPVEIVVETQYYLRLCVDTVETNLVEMYLYLLF